MEFRFYPVFLMLQTLNNKNIQWDAGFKGNTKERSEKPYLPLFIWISIFPEVEKYVLTS